MAIYLTRPDSDNESNKLDNDITWPVSNYTSFSTSAWRSAGWCHVTFHFRFFGCADAQLNDVGAHDGTSCRLSSDSAPVLPVLSYSEADGSRPKMLFSRTNERIDIPHRVGVDTGLERRHERWNRAAVSEMSPGSSTVSRLGRFSRIEQLFRRL